MTPIATVGSKCSGEYLTDVGDHKEWLPVSGKIIEGSDTCFVEGLSVARIGDDVIFQTLNGPKRGTISDGADTNFADQTPVAMLGSTVTGSRLRNAAVSGNCSGKVSVF